MFARLQLSGSGLAYVCTRCEILKQFLQRSFRTSAYCAAGGKWRQQHGYDPSGNRYGPLHDTPDWSYADGRPAPLTYGQLKKREERIEMAKNIKTMVDQLNFAKDRYAKIIKEKDTRRKRTIENKLKPKSKT